MSPQLQGVGKSGRGGGIIGRGDGTRSSRKKRKRKRKGNTKVKPTGGHEEMQDIIPGGSEQGSGREEDHIPNTTLENQSEDDEDKNESICMEIVSIIHDIGQTLCQNDDCPFKDEIAAISENFSKFYLKTALQFSLAAHGEHEQAFMEHSRKSLTKQAGLNADLDSSSSEEEEDSDEESKKRSRF